MILSAVINCYNEELYIKLSIESISDFVDEIIVVDNCSSDNSIKIIEEVMKKNKKIKLFKLNKTHTLNYVRNFAVSQASNEWMIKWDGDFIAYNNKKDDDKYFGNLIDIVEKYKNNYDVFLLYSLNLSGDIYHYDIRRQYLGLSGDTFICKKNNLSFVSNDKYNDLCNLVGNDGTKKSLRIYYLNNPEKNSMYFIHMYGVKSVEYLLYRCFMSEFNIYCENQKDNIDFWVWFKEYKNKDKDDGIKYMNNEFKKHYKLHTCKLPHILNENKYLLIYENNNIVGRKENV